MRMDRWSVVECRKRLKKNPIMKMRGEKNRGTIMRAEKASISIAAFGVYRPKS